MFTATAAIIAIACLGGPAAAQSAPPGEMSRGDAAHYVASAPGNGRFALAVNGRPVPLLVASEDLPGVARAAGDLQRDLDRVTGHAPPLRTDSVHGARRVVIIGTLGHSAIVDRLVRAGRLDTAGVAGRWETYLLQVVPTPFPGVTQALVIAGSDRRGTIYGIYDLSAQIGVSPWYWWADAPVPHHGDLYVLPGRHTDGEPAVRYRGIFINDEAPALSGWAREKFGGFNHDFYAHVFELILRLKGNYLWPAMWGSAFATDDTLNPVLAEQYGIVMGTSHHEPMTRAQAEWHRFGSGAWNYEQNDSTLRAFWRQGIQRMDGRENVVTIGMRGDGDMPMTQGSNITLLERIVADQRKIIADVTGRPASATPQLWALYKEVQDYYDKGMRVPDDVTLLFSDDNWGNLRRLPGAADRNRPGGFGIYYHFDYVGGPRNYKWINTNQISRVWEQMHLAHAYGANRIWIVNVGDIKPMELPTQFFLDYAWNPDAIPAERPPAYAAAWVRQQLPALRERDVATVAHALAEYTKLNARRKPELLDTATYSLTNYREADRVLEEWSAVERDVQRVAAQVPASHRDAYFELVLHPVAASANLARLHVTAARNRQYARELRASTNALADSVRLLFDRDAALSHEYNHGIAGGKWAHMMDQTHIGYTYWQEPPRDVMPRVDRIHVPAVADMGVYVEGQEPSRRGPAETGRARELALPIFDAYRRQRSYVDVYNRGSVPFVAGAKASVAWIVVQPSALVVNTEQRVWVSVDWAKAPAGVTRVPITLSGPDGRSLTVQAVVDNSRPQRAEAIDGFAEGDGYVSMEAEHYSGAVAPGGVRWQRIPQFGRTLSGVTAFPVTAAAQTPGGASPRLEYRAMFTDSGRVGVSAYVAPSLDFTGTGHGLRYAISLDDEPPQIVNVTADTSTRAWNGAVANDIRIGTTQHVLHHPGEHIVKFWMVDPGVVLEKIVVDAGGVRPSYLGPPESFRHPTPATAAAASR